ncbi:MAG: hypothetical protein NW206_05080 [Hyphomonadaceae bacterium]|nr:hypothetical protein [Hyphomonadaceae bacterium]
MSMNAVVKLLADAGEACMWAHDDLVQQVKATNPDPKHVSTSYADRSNLSLRMHNRPFSRMTNAFSKCLESHVHMVALYTMFYNFVRAHKSLRVTPAMQAGLSDTIWTFEYIVAKIDYYAPQPKKRGPYKKRERA